ncbi:MAG: hypothetical protein KA408_05815 [Flavobacteriales bacterium]|nr:hypothetical protein [Flavobacteriales bacterium]
MKVIWIVTVKAEPMIAMKVAAMNIPVSAKETLTVMDNVMGITTDITATVAVIAIAEANSSIAIVMTATRISTVNEENIATVTSAVGTGMNTPDMGTVIAHSREAIVTPKVTNAEVMAVKSVDMVIAATATTKITVIKGSTSGVMDIADKIPPDMIVATTEKTKGCSIATDMSVTIPMMRTTTAAETTGTTIGTQPMRTGAMIDSKMRTGMVNRNVHTIVIDHHLGPKENGNYSTSTEEVQDNFGPYIQGYG